jgi:hypothetical protein
MAYFGNRPKKPGSVPGAASGFQDQKELAHRRGVRGRLERRLKDGRRERAGRNTRQMRSAR